MSTIQETPMPTTATTFTPITATTELSVPQSPLRLDASAPPTPAPKKGPGGKHETMKVYGPEEAALVHSLVQAHAPRWTHIAKLVSEATNTKRTAASIRNYYKRFNASKAIAERDSDIKKLNRCQLCGQIKRGHICSGTAFVSGPASTSPPKQLTTKAAAPAKPAAPPVAPAAVAAPASAAPASGSLKLVGQEQDPLPPVAPAAVAFDVAPGDLSVMTPGSAFSVGLSPFSRAFGQVPTGPFSLSSMLGSPATAAYSMLLPSATTAAGSFSDTRTPTALAHEGEEELLCDEVAAEAQPVTAVAEPAAMECA